MESSGNNATQKELSETSGPDVPDDEATSESLDKSPETTSVEQTGETGEEDASKNDGERSDEGPTPGSADDPLVVVDDEHGLSPDYSPDDLEPLHPLGLATFRDEKMELRRDAAEATANMVSDAASEDIGLLICSAYRSYDEQSISYGRMTTIYGEPAKSLVARPGYSEHQLGTAIDVSSPAVDYRLVREFGDTEAYRWLDENAVDYGFVLSYPEEAEEATGYQWEPWHYRYIGRENAMMYAEGDYESPQHFFMEEGVIPEYSA